MTGIEAIYAMSLGGNLPFGINPPEETLGEALAALAAEGVMIRAISRFFATPAFPAGSGPDFVNAAALVATPLPPAALLALFHDIEARFGRERRQRWAGRTLDLDLLTAGDRLLPDRATFDDWQSLPLAQQMTRTPEHLILPHPRLTERPFVLIPLCDIAPDWLHPVLGQTVRQLCAALSPEQIAEIRPI